MRPKRASKLERDFITFKHWRFFLVWVSQKGRSPCPNQKEPEMFKTGSDSDSDTGSGSDSGSGSVSDTRYNGAFVISGRFSRVICDPGSTPFFSVQPPFTSMT